MRDFPIESRNLLIIAVVALVGGLTVGLFLAWVVWPVQVTNVDVPDLKSSSQDDYIVLTASAFVYDQDLDRARARLALLKNTKINDRVSNLARVLAASGKPEAGYVAALAIAPGASLDAGSFTLFAHGDIDAALITGTTGSVDAGGSARA